MGKSLVNQAANISGFRPMVSGGVWYQGDWTKWAKYIGVQGYDRDMNVPSHGNIWTSYEWGYECYGNIWTILVL